MVDISDFQKKALEFVEKDKDVPEDLLFIPGMWHFVNVERLKHANKKIRAYIHLLTKHLLEVGRSEKGLTLHERKWDLDFQAWVKAHWKYYQAYKKDFEEILALEEGRGKIKLDEQEHLNRIKFWYQTELRDLTELQRLLGQNEGRLKIAEKDPILFFNEVGKTRADEQKIVDKIESASDERRVFDAKQVELAMVELDKIEKKEKGEEKKIERAEKKAGPLTNEERLNQVLNMISGRFDKTLRKRGKFMNLAEVGKTYGARVKTIRDRILSFNYPMPQEGRLQLIRRYNSDVYQRLIANFTEQGFDVLVVKSELRKGGILPITKKNVDDVNAEYERQKTISPEVAAGRPPRPPEEKAWAGPPRREPTVPREPRPAERGRV